MTLDEEIMEIDRWKDDAREDADYDKPRLIRVVITGKVTEYDWDVIDDFLYSHGIEVEKFEEVG